jgi:hypothetical protein
MFWELPNQGSKKLVGRFVIVVMFRDWTRHEREENRGDPIGYLLRLAIGSGEQSREGCAYIGVLTPPKSRLVWPHARRGGARRPRGGRGPPH